MNKEELKKEAEEYRIHFENELYLFENTDIFPKDIEEAYIAGAEPREKQNELLKQENTDLEKKNTALRQDWDVMKSTIADYEKENTELREKLEGAERARDYWKDSSFDWRHKCTSRKHFRAAVKAQKQLSKAKELIEDMYDQIPASHSDYYKDVMERARQFIKELEDE